MNLAAIGSNCVDYYQNLRGGLPCPGGGPVNMAVYTLRLGGTSSYIGPVGDDSYGALHPLSGGCGYYLRPRHCGL